MALLGKQSLHENIIKPKQPLVPDLLTYQKQVSTLRPEDIPTISYGDLKGHLRSIDPTNTLQAIFENQKNIIIPGRVSTVIDLAQYLISEFSEFLITENDSFIITEDP